MLLLLKKTSKCLLFSAEMCELMLTAVLTRTDFRDGAPGFRILRLLKLPRRDLPSSSDRLPRDPSGGGYPHV